MIQDRKRNRATAEIARAFQRGVAQGLFGAIKMVCEEYDLRTVVLSGGVFQNELLLADLKPLLDGENLQIGQTTRYRQMMAASALVRPRSLRLRSKPRGGLMHELSIAMSIVEMAQEEADLRGVTIDAVHIEVGPLSGVVAEALLFSYEVACYGTPLEGSRLLIKEVPIEVYCPACDAQKTLTSMQWFCCPECGTPTSEVVPWKRTVDYRTGGTRWNPNRAYWKCARTF